MWNQFTSGRRPRQAKIRIAGEFQGPSVKDNRRGTSFFEARRCFFGNAGETNFASLTT